MITTVIFIYSPEDSYWALKYGDSIYPLTRIPYAGAQAGDKINIIDQ